MSELLLLSGGIDSIALAAWRMPDCCLTIDYGQRPANAEIDASKEVCQSLCLNHVILQVPIGSLGAGILAGKSPSLSSPNEEFWPFRNQMLLTLGAMYAHTHQIGRVLIGTVNTDRRHADGSLKFISLISELIRFQEGGIEVLAPASHLNTVDLVRQSGVAPSILGWAHSCHRSNIACGACPGCFKHSAVMSELGFERPV